LLYEEGQEPAQSTARESEGDNQDSHLSRVPVLKGEHRAKGKSGAGERSAHRDDYVLSEGQSRFECDWRNKCGKGCDGCEEQRLPG
jgi:hypothetical protein